MVRWIKKNARYFLIAFGVLLMVAFIVPQQAFQGGADSVTAFTVAGSKISVAQAQDAGRATALVSSLIPSDPGAPAPVRPMRFDHNDSTRWLLMLEEARAGGFVGAKDDAGPLMRRLAEGQAGMVLREKMSKGEIRDVPSDPAAQDKFFTDLFRNYTQQIEGILRERVMTTRTASLRGDEVLAQWQGISRMIDQHNKVPQFSTPRLIRTARQLGDTAIIQYAFIPVSNEQAQKIPAPSDEQLSAFYNRFRDTPAGGGEYGIGYRMPDRVKLAWIKLERALFDNAVTLDPVEVQKRLMGSPAGTGATREGIEKELRRAAADRAMTIAKESIKRGVLQATAKLGDEGPYKKLPAGYTPPDLQAIARAAEAEVREKTGMNVGPLSVGATPAWMTRAQLSADNPLSGYTLSRGSEISDVPMLAFNARELKPAPSKPPLPTIQAGVPLTDTLIDKFSGSSAYVMVSGVRPESSPESLDEVREQVVSDWRRVQALTALSDAASGYAASGAETGLVRLSDTLKTQGYAARLEQNIPVTRRGLGRRDEAIVDASALVDAVMSRADQLDYRSALDQSSAPKRTFAVPLPRSMGVAVVQITGYRPVTREVFAAAAQRLAQEGARDPELERVYAEGSPFETSALKKRLRVEGLKDDQKD